MDDDNAVAVSSLMGADSCEMVAIWTVKKKRKEIKKKNKKFLLFLILSYTYRTSHSNSKYHRHDCGITQQTHTLPVRFASRTRFRKRKI